MHCGIVLVLLAASADGQSMPRRPRCKPMFHGRPSATSDHAHPGPFALQSCDFEHVMDWGLAAAIAKMFIDHSGTEASVLELGAGCGCYTDFFLWMGFDVRAVDGTHGISNLTNGMVSNADLSAPQTFRPAQWVLSLEVGEHIPSKYMATFLGNMVNHARTGVVLSWAIRHQTDSPAHPNELDNKEVIGEMEKLGMTYMARASEFLRTNAGNFCCTYFKKSVMVFKKLRYQVQTAEQAK